MAPGTVQFTAAVFVKRRKNIERLIKENENEIRDFTMSQIILRGLHVLALGFWFGGAGFFNFFAAPSIFASFKDVVAAGPSDRTAYETIISADAITERKDALASALAGAAVGPVFPLYFAMQAVCGCLALITALSWWRTEGKVHRWRVFVIAVAVLTVVIGWPISNHVSELRLQRFALDAATATNAKAAFASWHLVSLFLSFVTVCLAGVALALASRLPSEPVANLVQIQEEEKSLV